MQVARGIAKDHFKGCIDNIQIDSQMLPVFAFKVAEQQSVDTCSAVRYDERDSVKSYACMCS